MTINESTATSGSSTTGPVASGFLVSPPTPRPTYAAGDRDPEQVRAELNRLRAELSETVEALVERLDVPARVQGKAREVTDRARQTASQVVDQAQQKAQEAGHLVTQKVPAVTDLVRRRWMPVTAAAGAGVLVVGLLVVRTLLRRSA